MDENLLIKIVNQLNTIKNVLSKTDGHNIESITISEDYDQYGNCVRGVSIRYSENIKSGTFELIDYVENVAKKKCHWFRYSIKGCFVYFE